MTRRSAGTSARSSRVDIASGTVDIKRDTSKPHPRAIVPLPWVRAKAHQERLIEIGEWVAEHGIEGPGPHRAIRELLHGVPPRAGQAPGESLARPDESDLEAARRLVLALDHTTLAIQGPPGSGKTYSGARMICTLLAAGKRVGITGTSHKVIGNLLAEVLRAAVDEGVEVRADPARPAAPAAGRRAGRPGQGCRRRARIDWRTAARISPRGRHGCGPRRRSPARLDVLFVDEAGQISLANVVAMSHGDRQHRAARRPAAARPAAARHAPARRRTVGARPRPRRGSDDRRRSRPVPRDGRGGCTRRCARSRPRSSTTTASSPSRTWPRSVLRSAARPGRRRRARGCCRSPRSGRTATRRSRRPRSADLARSIVGGSWTDAEGVTRPLDVARRPDRRPVQRPGRRDPAAAAGRGTRRHGRQVPGPGGADQHLLADDVCRPSSRRAAWTSSTAATD